ncbi:MAG: hypothetical protein HKN79_09420 [Flavobacteriales bacterium]|nr:hypothetical protein [Flavobacteriales bacterium]
MTQAPAQENCSNSSALWRDYKRFIPTEESPIFTMRINYVVPQRSDGSGNFQADDPEHMALLKGSLRTINKLWGNLKEPKDTDCYPYDDFLPDSYIRFELNEIIFVQNDYFWNAENGSGCPNQRNWFLNELDEEINKDPRYAGAINIFLPNMPKGYEEVVVQKSSVDPPDAPPPCSELPSNQELDRSSRINMAGSYNKFWWMKNIVPGNKEYAAEGKNWNDHINYWMSGSFNHTMTHELGHSMGLNHANEHHKRNECDESIMNQRHGKPHNYLQPTELGKIHRNLRMTNIREFLAEEVYSPIPFVIDEDTEFSMSFRAYEDIIVKSGATLTISCDLDLPEQADVIVEPGATLIINDGMIHHRNAPDPEGAIILQKEKRCFLRKKGKESAAAIDQSDPSSYQGRIVVKKVKRKKD